MKVQNAVKKLLKAGAENKTEEGSNKYRFILNGCAIEFFKNGSSEEVSCISSCELSLEEERDPYSDYFPETFHNNIKQAIDFVTGNF